MKTLEEHNRERGYKAPKYPKPNGIECPKCGAELHDKDNTILLSMPPKKTVVCLKCGYFDYALV